MDRLPSLFISHGAPSYALEPGKAGAGLGALGRALPRPAAVLVVSPHWTTHTLRVSTAPGPETIHDFGGFDPALYQIRYPAPGHPELAARTLDTLRGAGFEAEADPERGLDHGTWVPLLHLYADARVPVFQVSMPQRLDAPGAFALGQALAPLAAEGVLVVGSGSLTHNLREYFGGAREPAPYVVEFSAWVREAVLAGDHERLVKTLEIAPHAPRAHPTPEHFWPLLVAAGAAAAPLPASVLAGEVDHGVLAMDSFLFGEAG